MSYELKTECDELAKVSENKHSPHSSYLIAHSFKLIVLSSYLLAFNLTSLFAQEDYSWFSPSENSSESMPCGGGDIGLNVWVEKGDLFFYISRSGTYDEHNTLLKQGRVRVRLTPNPFLNSKDFKQTLHQKDGFVEIQASGTSVKIWVDVFKPLIHVDVKSKNALQTMVSYENWRYRERYIRPGEGQQNSYKWATPAGQKTAADSIQPFRNGVVFYHHNSEKTVFDVAVEQQGLQKVKNELMNPLGNLISGGKLWGKLLQFSGTSSGEYAGTDFLSYNFTNTKKVREISFSIALQNLQSSDIESWKRELEKTISGIKKKDDEIKSKAWWNEFYNRSFIRASGEAEKITTNYNLFRYMLGCNVYGNAPTRFNGGLFTFDPVFVDDKTPFTPDYRKWGGGTYTAQNQRLVYWPLLKSGDADLMIPQFDFYKNILKNAELRSQVYWNHPGACFAEQLENYGLPNPSEYGWKRPDGFDKGVEYNAWLEYEWETALEFCQMILETKNYFNADISSYLPLIKSTVRFFDEHYQYLASLRGRKKLDGNGHLILFPASACETYKMANNPSSTIAGLRRVLTCLGDPDSILRRIPPVPFREMNGKTMIAPAKTWERINNTESPQLYPVFPWRFYGVGKKDIEIAINTFVNDTNVVKFRSSKGWKQDNIWAACLGLTDVAQKLTFEKLADGPHRFPAFWGPDFDWTPDHNRGGSGMIGLQEMLLQTTDDGKIILFPAWPKNLDVHFKLHAPGNTVVEASLKNGKIELLKTIPQNRISDIIFLFH